MKNILEEKKMKAHKERKKRKKRQELARYREHVELAPADPIRHYIMEINKYPILSKEEEQRLIEAYKKRNDHEAARKLLMSHLRLVVKIAFEYFNKYYCGLFDLIQEGNVGLLMALKKFDPAKGVRFSTYAQWWIKAYILKYLMDNYSIIRIGHSRVEKRLFYSLKKVKEQLYKMGFDPDNPKLLAEITGEDEKDVIEMNKRLTEAVLSLEQPGSEFENRAILDTVESDEGSVEKQVIDKELYENLKSKFNEFYETLNEKERAIWDKRLLADNPVSLQKIGDEFNISRERVRQIEARLIKKLRKFLSEQEDFDVKDYLRDE